MMLAGVIAVTASFSCQTLADSRASATSPAAGPPASVTCQDQFMLDRRDSPAAAIKNFQQCNAVRNVATNMEYFTFWFVTLPAALQQQNGMFEKAWNNNIGMLTGRIVNFKKEQAVKLLDDSIVRGLKKGKREDLIEKWLASHNPEALAQPVRTKPAGTDAAVAMTAPVPLPAVPDKPAAAPQAAVTEKPAPSRTAERPKRPVPRAHRRPAPIDAYQPPSISDAGGSYATAAMPPGPYAAQPYYPPSARQLEYNIRPTGLAPPGSYPPPYVPAAGQLPATGQAPSAAYAPQPSSYGPTAQQAEQNIAATVPAASGPYGPELIGRQIEKNVRTIAQLIEENLRTVEQVLFK